MAEPRERWGRLHRGGAWAVGFLILCAAIGPLLLSVGPDEQSDPAASRYRPPGTRLSVVALTDGRERLADQVERTDDALRVSRLGRWEEIPLDRVTNLTPTGVDERRLFILGTDRYGRDLLARILHGARVSLTIGVLAVALAMSLGLLVGAVATLGGPVVDAVLMRLVDAALAFPRLFLLLALAALFRPSNGVLILILGGTAWMGVSRFFRAELRESLAQDYATAARSLGIGRWRLLARHLLPNSLTAAIAMASLAVGEVILAESTLSFLGLGLQPPQASWGNLISEGRDALLSAWWASVFPGAAIVLAVVAFNLVGEGFRGALDPRGLDRDSGARRAH